MMRPFPSGSCSPLAPPEIAGPAPVPEPEPDGLEVEPEEPVDLVAAVATVDVVDVEPEQVVDVEPQEAVAVVEPEEAADVQPDDAVTLPQAEEEAESDAESESESGSETGLEEALSVEAPQPEPVMRARLIPTPGATPTALPEVSGQVDQVQVVEESAPDDLEASSVAPVPEVEASTELSPPSSTNEVREYIRAAASERGLDPDIVMRVVLAEGGLTPATWTGDGGSSFGPFQLHYGGIATGGNSVAGMGDTFTRDTGLRASEPDTWREQVDWSLDQVKQTGWKPWHGAAAVGIGSWDGIRPQAAVTGPREHVDVPNQFAAGLSTQDAYAACGPVAAVAVARWLGRNPSVPEALAMAKQNGWTVNGGMNGIANEKRLLDAMNIPSRLETRVVWQQIQTDALSGNPVILSTPEHYWVIDDYNPDTQTYHVGRSGLAFRGGAEWMTAAQIEKFGHGVNGVLYIDHPLSTPVSTEAA